MNNVDVNLLKYINDSDKLLVGVSGGADSVLLLDNLVRMGYSNKLVVAHVNHGFREESVDEYNFVKELCIKYNVIFEGIEFDIPNYMSQNNLKSDEKVCRDFRYNFFKDLMLKYKTNVILLGHHGDDLVEGVLMRLVWGAYGRGLISMTKINDLNKEFVVLRPLLDMTKEEIYKEAKSRNLEWCEDLSNKDNKYLRNRYRNNILPLVKLENENVHKTILKFSEYKSEEENYFNIVVDEKFNDIVKTLSNNFDIYYIDKNDLLNTHTVIKRRLLVKLLKDVLGIDYVSNNVLENVEEKMSNNYNTDYQLLLKGMYVVNSSDKVYFVKEEVKDLLDSSNENALEVTNDLFFDGAKVKKLLVNNKIPSAFRKYVYIENDSDNIVLKSMLGTDLRIKNVLK